MEELNKKLVSGSLVEGQETKETREFKPSVSIDSIESDVIYFINLSRVIIFYEIEGKVDSLKPGSYIGVSKEVAKQVLKYFDNFILSGMVSVMSESEFEANKKYLAKKAKEIAVPVIEVDTKTVDYVALPYRPEALDAIYRQLIEISEKTASKLMKEQGKEENIDVW